MLFVSAKVSHLAMLPQAKVDAKQRARNMITQMDKLGLGACLVDCPKSISIANIARLNREYLVAKFSE